METVLHFQISSSSTQAEIVSDTFEWASRLSLNTESLFQLECWGVEYIFYRSWLLQTVGAIT